MPSFLPGFEMFALAGAVAALGPIAIHLMNRRRFRVVEWAAMEFLLEAVQRNRRILRLRDILLLLLRTAVVLLFGLALARPFFSGSFSDEDSDAALHAVLLVDNSLSTNYQTLGRNVLDLSKTRAEEFIDELPEGSRITVVPVCGSPAGYTLDAYANREDARAALKRIVAVDRSSGAAVAADLAREACRQVPELSKRVVLIGDQQKTNWTTDAASIWKDLPEVQVVDVGPQDVENSWVEDFRVQDSIADVETMTVFSAVLRHVGPSTRENVSVSLSVDGTEVDSKTVDLSPGQSLAVSFPYQFDATPEAGQPLFSRAEVSLSPDRLPEDDARFLAVPVVASLPVVFVDQYGEDEW